jgi:hypothetical protein
MLRIWGLSQIDINGRKQNRMMLIIWVPRQIDIHGRKQNRRNRPKTDMY